jgi:hypothetical protein
MTLGEISLPVVLEIDVHTDLSMEHVHVEDDTSLSLEALPDHKA